MKNKPGRSEQKVKKSSKNVDLQSKKKKPVREDFMKTVSSNKEELDAELEKKLRRQVKLFLRKENIEKIKQNIGEKEEKIGKKKREIFDEDDVNFNKGLNKNKYADKLLKKIKLRQTKLHKLEKRKKKIETMLHKEGQEDVIEEKKIKILKSPEKNKLLETVKTTNYVEDFEKKPLKKRVKKMREGETETVIGENEIRDSDQKMRKPEDFQKKPLKKKNKMKKMGEKGTETVIGESEIQNGEQNERKHKTRSERRKMKKLKLQLAKSKLSNTTTGSEIGEKKITKENENKTDESMHDEKSKSKKKRGKKRKANYQEEEPAEHDKKTKDEEDGKMSKKKKRKLDAAETNEYEKRKLIKMEKRRKKRNEKLQKNGEVPNKEVNTNEAATPNGGHTPNILGASGSGSKKREKYFNSKNTPMREKLMNKLKAAQFRYLNEQLYTSKSEESKEFFRKDPESFQAYHEGFKKQVTQWPINPIDIIIKSLKERENTSSLVIADLGCGEAKLASSLPQHTVHSLDLVALNDKVTPCDMTRTPLKSGSIDVAVFCLSLMGTDLSACIKEANRILKIGGELKIAEVESRFDDVKTFISDIEKYGFAKQEIDLDYSLFYFLNFRKGSNLSKTKKRKLPDITLRPCLYKKR